MTLRSRSCVIGLGVAMFSIWSAIAFASKTPTQIGSTRSPSLSRRMTMGMLVTGSTIRPLMTISLCIVLLALRPAARASSAVAHDVAAAGPAYKVGPAWRPVKDRARPQRLCGPARSMSTMHQRAQQRRVPGKFTTVLPVVRPDSSVSRRRLTLSTSTSTVVPTACCVQRP